MKLAISQLHAAMNPDGRLELFALVRNAAVPYSLWHRSQLFDGSGWSEWTYFGGHEITDFVVGKNEDGRLELFAIGGDKLVYHKWQVAPNNEWSEWAVRVGAHADGIAVANNADGRLEIFIIDNHRLKHCWQTKPNNGWSAWYIQEDSYPIHWGLTVAQNLDGRLEVFAVSFANEMFAIKHNWQATPNGLWDKWAVMGALDHAGSFDVGRNQDGRLEIFWDVTYNFNLPNLNDQIRHKWQTAPNNGWGDWFYFPSLNVTGGTGDFVVIQNQDGRLELFTSISKIIGRDESTYHIWQTEPNGEWSGWASLGKQYIDHMTAILDSKGIIHLFGASGPAGDYTVYHIAQIAPNGQWGNWSSLGEIIIEEPAPIINNFTPLQGQIGASVTITGSHFSTVTAVRFNGINASFIIVSDTTITTTVPAGATKGPIQVVNGGGSVNSANSFTVIEVPPPLEETKAVTMNAVSLWQGLRIYEGSLNGEGVLQSIQFPRQWMFDVRCLLFSDRLPIAQAIQINQGETINGSQLSTLYGSQTPNLPIHLNAYLESSQPGTQINSFWLSLTYKK